MTRRVVVMLVGLCGATASTTVATVLQSAMGKWPIRSTTGMGQLAELPLVNADNLSFSGWDLSSQDLLGVVRRHGIVPSLDPQVEEALAQIRPMVAVRTALDIPLEDSHDNFTVYDEPDKAIETVADDINNVRGQLGAESVIVVYLGSPHATSLEAGHSLRMPTTWRELISQRDHLPSSLLYALGSIKAGAHFVDFTPGNCLESDLVLREAEEHAVQVAGRDGSTGQTMMKLAVGELLKSRGFCVKGWYSTNVIGNHDGYVLSIPEHSRVKLADKMDGLAALLEYDSFDHHVTIDYLPHWGDSKESWDAISAEGWMGSELNIRINWRGEDSMLAAAMIFDLARLIEYGSRYNLSGLRTELGYFFKRPLGCEGRSPYSLHSELVDRYISLQG